jgi:hypothetical protein
VSATISVLATVKAEARFGEEGLSLLRLGGLSNEMPSWFQRIERDFGQVVWSGHAWMDHPASDGESLVVQPYDLCHESLVDLMDFADRFSLNVFVSALSAHHPTRTLAIYLTPREEGRAA